jgi:hypothetical protein
MHLPSPVNGGGIRFRKLFHNYFKDKAYRDVGFDGDAGEDKQDASAACIRIFLIIKNQPTRGVERRSG